MTSFVTEFITMCGITTSPVYQRAPVSPTDALLLNWPSMSICKNSLEERVSSRIALFAHI